MCVEFFSGISSDVANSPVVSTHVGQWLSSLNLADYESHFVNYGYDDVEFIVSESYQIFTTPNEVHVPMFLETISPPYPSR